LGQRALPFIPIVILARQNGDISPVKGGVKAFPASSYYKKETGSKMSIIFDPVSFAIEKTVDESSAFILFVICCPGSPGQSCKGLYESPALSLPDNRGFHPLVVPICWDGG